VGSYAGIVLLATRVVSITTPVAVAAFAARLNEAVDLDAVRAELAEAGHRPVEPAHVWVWIRQPE